MKAVEKLSGRSLDESAIKSGCDGCGVDYSREMNCEFSPIVPGSSPHPLASASHVCVYRIRLTICAVDEFVQLIRHLESKNDL